MYTTFQKEFLNDYMNLQICHSDFQLPKCRAVLH